MYLSVIKLIALIWVGLGVVTQAQSQQVEFNQDAATDPTKLAEEMPSLAKSVLALYRESDRKTYLDGLFRLQLVAGDYPGASASLASLRELYGPTQSQSAVSNVRWEIYAKALSRQVARQESFDEAFKQSFREALTPLDNQTAIQVLYTFGTSLHRLEAQLRQALDQQKGKAAITLPDAVALVRRYLAVQAYRRFQPLVPQLSDEDDERRYVIAKDILVRTPNGFAFVSAPFQTPIELSGLFSMRLDFITNKKDFDFNVQLYELKPDGEYLQLSYHWARASYVKDRRRRELLAPGRREQLDFESSLLTSRQFTAGSRLVVVLNIIKRPDAQINYGTGKDVSDETIADAKEPLSIKWFNDSFVTIPVLMTR